MLEQLKSVNTKVERAKVKASDMLNQEENFHSFVYNFHTYCSTTEIRKKKVFFHYHKVKPDKESIQMKPFSIAFH